MLLDAACKVVSDPRRDERLLRKRSGRIEMFRLLILPAIVLQLAAASLPTARPEEVGLSTERLQRIHEMVMRHVEARDISGAVTMVARRGRVVHFEAHGLMDIEAKKPMTKDALFRLASSSKPITAAAILMLMEEGKLKLTDPVAKYIPEFRNSKVALEAVRGAVPMSDGTPRRRPLLRGSGESRYHHRRPADAHVRPGYAAASPMRISRVF